MFQKSRYHIVFDTTTYMQRHTFSYFLQRIAFIWILSMWIGLPDVVEMPETENFLSLTGQCVTPLKNGYRIFLALGNYLLPTIIILKTYRDIYQKLKDVDIQFNSDKKQEASMIKENDDEVIPLKRQRRALHMLAIIILAACVSWLPFTVVYAVLGYTDWSGKLLTMRTCLAIGFSNSAMNPVIYARCNPDFRTGFKKVITLGGRIRCL